MKRVVAGFALLLSACGASEPNVGELSDITLYRTTVVTSDPAQPVATGVALSGETIAAVGDFDALRDQLTGADVDESFADVVMLPGLIDPHVHMTLGAMMYGAEIVPPWDVPVADGMIDGLTTRTALLSRIAQIERSAKDGPLVLWGYHDLIQGDVRRADLDAISTTRPIMLWHWSGHDFYLNSAAIRFLEIDASLHETFEGVELDENGGLTGRIYEDALLAIFPKLATILMSPEHIARGWDRYETLLRDAGVTTVAEMGYGIFGQAAEDAFLAQHHSDADGYAVYLVPEHRAFARAHEDPVAAMAALRESDPRVLPQVKLFSDAAFYSQTMAMSDPYVAGQSEGSKGLFVTEPEALPDLMARYWNVGLDIHVHSNGDAAQDSTINAIASLPPEASEDQRVILEHAALLSPSHIGALSDLPVGVSAASHYVRYMGTTMSTAIGRDRARWLSPMRSVSDSGIHMTLHSDAPLAPPYPLLAAQAHLLRDTVDGRVANADERLTREQALRAITLDAAWSLGLENVIGSIEAGKRADFTVVTLNPLETAPEDWDEIEVIGRIRSGRAFE